MPQFRTLMLALAAQAVYVALCLSPIRERAAPIQSPIEKRDQSLSTDDVQLSFIPPFEPWPGFFEGKGSFSSRGLPERNLQKRGPETQAVCAKTKVPRERERFGFFKHSEAQCDRNDPIRKKFKVDCLQLGDAQNGNMFLRGLDGECEGDTVCIEFRGFDQVSGRPSKDINCVDRDTIRQWAIDSTKAQTKEVCSPSYLNNVKGGNTVKMALQVNVLDSKQLENISPADVFYTLDGKKIGAERAHDALVGSGIVEVPHGSKIRACVEAIPGQILWAVVGLTALLIENGQGSTGHHEV